jgi:O-antigen/teichoic acid export membrane protein
MRLPSAGARHAGHQEAPIRGQPLLLLTYQPAAAEAVTEPQDRGIDLPAGRGPAARHRLSAVVAGGALLALPLLAWALGPAALGQYGVLLGWAAFAAILVGAGLDAWGAQAIAGLDRSVAPRVAARVIRFQALHAALLLPPAGLALSWLPGSPVEPLSALAVCLVAAATGVNPRWWHDAHGRTDELAGPALIASAAALALVLTAVSDAAALPVALCAAALAFAWMPWAAWRLNGRAWREPPPASLPGALLVPWHAAVRAGGPTLLRRLGMAVPTCLPATLAALAFGLAGAGAFVLAERLVSGLAALAAPLRAAVLARFHGPDAPAASSRWLDRNSVAVWVVGSIAAAALLGGLAPLGARWLGGTGFESAASTLAILSPILVLGTVDALLDDAAVPDAPAALAWFAAAAFGVAMLAGAMQSVTVFAAVCVAARAMPTAWRWRAVRLGHR